MNEKNPIVFISYSHDNSEHIERVFQLSNKLRSEGIDCILDQYETAPPEGWPRWMTNNIKASEYVLMICTSNYYSRVMGLEDKGKGHGLAWEGNLIYNEIYHGGSINNKFIPVLLEDGTIENVPDPLKGFTYYNIDSPDEYEKLYWRLRGIKKEKPDLGPLRELESKPRRTMFFSSLIDMRLWELANWYMVAYLIPQVDDIPPYLLIVFKNFEIGVEIFKDLINVIGSTDPNDELRISIIEGDVPKQPHGYFVHITQNIDVTLKRLKDTNKIDNIDLYMTTARFHRMNTDSSERLNQFKEAYLKHGGYLLAPAERVEDENGKGFRYHPDYAIEKKSIHFIDYDKINEKGDYYSILKSKEVQEWKF